MIISLSINAITADLIRGLFRRKGRSCSGYQCRECISDSNCSGSKQQCSGGSCITQLSGRCTPGVRSRGCY